MEYLLNSPYVDRSKIIVFGRSLGGAVAISLAEKYQNNIAGWVLEVSAVLLNVMRVDGIASLVTMFLSRSEYVHVRERFGG